VECSKQFIHSSNLSRHKLVYFKQRYHPIKKKHVKQTLQCQVYVCSQCHLLFMNRLLFLNYGFYFKHIFFRNISDQHSLK